ncbi:MAG: diguanylate cyclase [Pseudomonadota bacterium]
MSVTFLDSPLARKIFRENFSTVGTGLGCVLFLFVLLSLYSGQKNLRTEAQYKVETLASSIANSLQNKDSQALEKLILNATNASTTLSVTVYDQKAQPVIAWNNVGQFDNASNLPASELINEVKSHLQLAQLIIAAPVINDGDLVGKIQISSSLRALYLHLFLTVFIGLIIIAIATTICARYLSKLSMKRLLPILDLATIAEQVANLGDYSLRAREQDDYELNDLHQHFNNVLQRMDAWESDRQSEIRERKEAERRLDILSNHDSLTKLPNRNYFQTLIKHCVDDAIVNDRLAGLMFIDIDNFKSMNDQFGYDAGDLILATLANRLCTVLRTTDTLCRVDGDEFAAILPQIDNAKMAQSLAERIIHAINQPMTLRGKKIILTASIGIACCPLHAQEPRSFLHNTDLALKKAKAAGRNNFCVFSG